jgi:hypothetical protein
MLNPCFLKLPKRPLNGKRDVELVFHTFERKYFYSYVNFSCNPYFELVGRSTFTCLDGIWEPFMPECRLSKKICTTKPAASTDTSVIINQVRTQVRIELDYQNNSKMLDIYLTAGYTCLPDQPRLRFKNKFKITEYKYIPKPYDRNVFYQNATCLGNNVWEILPMCETI